MKKAQAAMEFLITYGWVILIVLLAIGSLSYFDVLNPARFLPESCTLLPGLSCIDHKATNNEINLIIQNDMGKNLNLFNIEVEDCTTNTLPSFQDRSSIQFNLTECDNGIIGSKLKIDLIISFESEYGLTHSKKGQLITSVSKESGINEPPTNHPGITG